MLVHQTRPDLCCANLKASIQSGLVIQVRHLWCNNRRPSVRPCSSSAQGVLHLPPAWSPFDVPCGPPVCRPCPPFDCFMSWHWVSVSVTIPINQSPSSRASVTITHNEKWTVAASSPVALTLLCTAIFFIRTSNSHVFNLASALHRRIDLATSLALRPS